MNSSGRLLLFMGLPSSIHENLPLVIGGDYNILRHPSKKNIDHYQTRWPFLFNAVIDGLNLKEIQLARWKYTWANNLANPTFEKLDRVLIITEWEEKYPLTIVRALSRQVSDHTPLLLNSGYSSLWPHNLCSNLS
jgi:endonuclease/exonuclease/phosphatase family metal-dependent hydrolase